MGRRGPRPKTFARWLPTTGAVRLLCVDDEGDEKTVKVLVNKQGRPRWVETVATVEALSPVRVSALNEEGETLSVWDFVEHGGAERAPAPGYAKETGDTEDERLLKTFAHLLADAHRTSAEQLVRVTSLQSANFAEERKALASTLTSMDRAMIRMSRSTARFRVAPDGEEEPEDEAPEANANFVQELLGPILKRMVTQEVAGAVAPTTNGTGRANGA